MSKNFDSPIEKGFCGSTPVSGAQQFEEWFAVNGPSEANISFRQQSWVWDVLKNMCEKSWNASRAAVPVAERVGGEDAKK